MQSPDFRFWPDPQLSLANTFESEQMKRNLERKLEKLNFLVILINARYVIISLFLGEKDVAKSNSFILTLLERGMVDKFCCQLACIFLSIITIKMNEIKLGTMEGAF